jgi:YVTN family beta-propeller protein
MKSQGDITWRRSITAATGLALAWLLTPVPAASQNAYITNQGVYPNFSNKVTVVDTTTNKIVTTIDVGLAPAGLAVTPDGSKVYVANQTVRGTVSVIDAATNAVSAQSPWAVIPSASRSNRTAARSMLQIKVATAPYQS